MHTVCTYLCVVQKPGPHVRYVCVVQKPGPRVCTLYVPLCGSKPWTSCVHTVRTSVWFKTLDLVCAHCTYLCVVQNPGPRVCTLYVPLCGSKAWTSCIDFPVGVGREVTGFVLVVGRIGRVGETSICPVPRLPEEENNVQGNLHVPPLL